ncbi:MAG: SIS domain-containing protein [Spirochaetaceae bacterium]|jgi:D-sedoheptulose 7-phosphate isomerase|nr:SIS domain-containing protein [Spirochaetaceae bacterium]
MDYLQHLIERYPKLETAKSSIDAAYRVLVHAYESRRKLLVAGNGGSAADSEHLVGELMKGFVRPRPPKREFLDSLNRVAQNESDHAAAAFIADNVQGTLAAIALTNHSALSTACLNDMDGKIIFAQQVYGYGESGDVFLGISTSGNAKNVYYAAITAKAKGLKTIALSGGTGGLLAAVSDISIIVPEKETYKVQELHLPVYHTLALMLEEHFFS